MPMYDVRSHSNHQKREFEWKIENRRTHIMIIINASSPSLNSSLITHDILFFEVPKEAEHPTTVRL
jgi:hypothetical protein